MQKLLTSVQLVHSVADAAIAWVPAGQAVQELGWLGSAVYLPGGQGSHSLSCVVVAAANANVPAGQVETA